MLILQPIQGAPQVEVDYRRSEIFIFGKSLSEEPDVFFSQIICLIEEFPFRVRSMRLIFELRTFNTKSTASLIRLFQYLADKQKDGRSISIVWRCRYDDPEMLYMGEDFSQLAQIPFLYEGASLEYKKVG